MEGGDARRGLIYYASDTIRPRDRKMSIHYTPTHVVFAIEHDNAVGKVSITWQTMAAIMEQVAMRWPTGLNANGERIDG